MMAHVVRWLSQTCLLALLLALVLAGTTRQVNAQYVQIPQNASTSFASNPQSMSSFPTRNPQSPGAYNEPGPWGPVVWEIYDSEGRIAATETSPRGWSVETSYYYDPITMDWYNAFTVYAPSTYVPNYPPYGGPTEFPTAGVTFHLSWGWWGDHGGGYVGWDPYFSQSFTVVAN